MIELPNSLHFNHNHASLSKKKRNCNPIPGILGAHGYWNFGGTATWKLESIGISGGCFLRNWEQIGFRVHKNFGFGIMLPNAKLFLKLGSCLLLLGAHKFENCDIVNAYLPTYQTLTKLMNEVFTEDWQLPTCLSLIKTKIIPKNNITKYGNKLQTNSMPKYYV